MHDLFVALNPDRDDIRTFVWFEDKTRDTPLEVAHCSMRVLVNEAFGEDVQPGVSTRLVGRGSGEGVGAVSGIGEVRLRERVGDVRGQDRWVDVGGWAWVTGG